MSDVGEGAKDGGRDRYNEFQRIVGKGNMGPTWREWRTDMTKNITLTSLASSHYCEISTK